MGKIALEARGLMRLAAALPACAAAMAFAQPAPSPGTEPAWPDQDNGYIYACTAVHRDPHGTLTINVNVTGPRSGETTYFGQWTSAQGSGGLTLSYYLFEHDMRVTDLTDVGLTFEAHWRGNPRVRILLSRSGYYNGVPMAFGSDYARAVRGLRSTIVPLGELRGYAGGAPLTVMVMNRHGEVLARERLDPALLDAAIAAPEALRPEAHAMAADYRNRCERREETTDIMI